MICSLKGKQTHDIYHGVVSVYARKLPKELHEKARRLLDQIHAVNKVESLNIPPGNCLEKLKGNLKEYWSIRINNKWRIIFKWEKGDATDVEIIDYH